MVHGLSCLLAYGIFQDQGLNPYPLDWQVDSLPLVYQESLKLIFESQKRENSDPSTQTQPLALQKGREFSADLKSEHVILRKAGGPEVSMEAQLQPPFKSDWLWVQIRNKKMLLAWDLKKNYSASCCFIE